MKLIARLVVAFAGLALLAGCAGSGKPAGRMEDVAEMRATVTGLDLPKRLVTLRIEGEPDEVTVEAADSIKNLNQVEVGDEVLVSYTKALAWQVRPAGEGGPGIGTGEDVSAAPPGAKPSLAAQESYRLTASITAIDMQGGTVTLTGPRGGSRTFKVLDPANLKKVKVGDLVDITYTEALAVAVKPVKK